MQLLRTILIIVIIYYAVKLLARYVLPVLARYFIRRTQREYQKQYEKEIRKPGKMKEKVNPDKKKADDNLGEYVDYEEIKE
ncbi:MAG: hypothetical protein R2764_18425 [Bacteroidales bacterium]